MYLTFRMLLTFRALCNPCPGRSGGPLAEPSRTGRGRFLHHLLDIAGLVPATCRIPSGQRERVEAAGTAAAPAPAQKIRELAKQAGNPGPQSSVTTPGDAAHRSSLTFLSASLGST